MPMRLRVWRNNQFASWQPNIWDIVSLLLIFLLFILLARAALQMSAPYEVGQTLKISLDPHMLPHYAIRTVFRMAIGMACSLLFTFTIGTLAAKNRHAERFIIPSIDILQSIPVLGFLSISVVPFIALFPNSMMGPELAAIFAIFTAQAWNMALGFYQSLRTVPYELREASAMFHLSGWQQFWRVEVPFAMPSLIWNMMMSLSASWFFVTASEAITVNNQNILLPGIGSYIGMAIIQKNSHALVYAIFTMLIIILLYDQLLFRPLITWSEKFKAEQGEADTHSKSLLLWLMNKTRFLLRIGELIAIMNDAIVNFHATKRGILSKERPKDRGPSKALIVFWYLILSLFCIGVIAFLIQFIFKTVPVHEAWHVVVLGSFTALRIVVLIVLCSFIWVPIGVWIGMRPRVATIVQPIAQILAAFPANLLFPVVSMMIIKYTLNVNIWTSPLMILGTQWYILFNIIAGTSAIPKDLIHVAQNLELKRWLWWKRFVFPAIFPYFITGAITAAGGAWNTSIIAEVIHWGDHSLVASGLGAYITHVTNIGDFPRIALGISVMCVYVLLFNRIIWRPLYNLAEKRFQLD